MKAITIMTFKQKENSKSTYILNESLGEKLKNFTYTIKRDKSPELIGQEKINFEKRKVNSKGNSRQYDYCFVTKENGKTRMLTSFNFNQNYPLQAFGDFGGSALLIRFSDDMKELEIFVYKNQKYNAEKLFKVWTFGADRGLEVLEKEKAFMTPQRE